MITLIVSVFLFSTPITARKCDTIIQARKYTTTVYPSNCPTHSTVTVISTTSIDTTTTSTTTTTKSEATYTITISTTTTTTDIFTPQKRNKAFTCIPNNKDCHTNVYKNKCVKTIFCNPTVFLPCPPVYTKTTTSISTSTSINTVIVTSRTIIPLKPIFTFTTSISTFTTTSTYVQSAP
ncbi:hypothetical protein Glove_57g97 [Diversispora epigaea]|uniref:Uncharacterized protein n=1 Tax=Diversispora epigaea TaxID=1348612 RepID=A0A397JNB6_9GLOM|nr:hypothetical protein Glove_57g97 [Diversispora epigaea]